MTKIKAVGYIRVSTKTQVEKGFGLETQKDAIENFAKDSDIQLAKIFVDRGISGALEDDDKDISKRIGLGKLLQYCRLHNIKKIIVKNTSRLWRNKKANVYIEDMLRPLNIDIISIEQPTFTLYDTTASGMFLQDINIAVDTYERNRIKSRLSSGRRTKAKKGIKPTGKTPLGYKYDPKTKDVIVDKKEKPVVQEIFKLREQGYSFNKIAKHLNSLGIKTRQGNQWRMGRIKEIIDNKFYQGYVIYDGIIAKGQHETFI